MPDASPDFRSKLLTQLTTIDYSGAWLPEWTVSLRLSSQSDKLDSGADVISTYDTRRRQFTWLNTWTPLADQQLVLALDLLDESIHSTDYQAPSRDNTGLVLGYTGRVADNKLQVDLRFDHNSVYGNQTTGKLGWGIDIDAAWSLRALAGTAFRAPTFNDLYFPDFGVVTRAARTFAQHRGRRQLPRRQTPAPAPRCTSTRSPT